MEEVWFKSVYSRNKERRTYERTETVSFLSYLYCEVKGKGVPKPSDRSGNGVLQPHHVLGYGI